MSELVNNKLTSALKRYGELKDLTPDATSNRSRLTFEISSRNFFGLRSHITSLTGGEAVVLSELLPMRIRDRSQEAAKSRNGVFVSNTTGDINPCDYGRLAQRGKLWITSDTVLYEGMLMGELAEGAEDIDTNICKKHDGYEKAKPGGGFVKSLEESLTYLAEDECLEVTPKRIAMRKLILDTAARKHAVRNRQKLAMKG